MVTGVGKTRGTRGTRVGTFECPGYGKRGWLRGRGGRVIRCCVGVGGHAWGLYERGTRSTHGSVKPG